MLIQIYNIWWLWQIEENFSAKHSKWANRSQVEPEGSLFNSYYTGVGEDTTPFPCVAPLTLDPYIIMLSVKQGVFKYHFFESLV